MNAAILIIAAALELTPGKFEVLVRPKAQKRDRVVQFAAEEMTNFLSRALGAPVKLTTKFNPNRTQIVLGSNDWSVAAGINTAKLPRDGFVLKTKGNALYIAGADDNPKSLKGGTHYFQRATLFGVYEFLERYVGCRFYFPGELGEVVPRKDRVTVPELDETCAPAWTERSFSTNRGSWYDETKDSSAEFMKELYRLRMETRMLPCCHGQYKSKMVQRFGKEHPEYFYMNKKGERVVSDAETKHVHDSHLCYTSAAWDEIYKDAKSYLSGEGPEVRGIIMGKKPPYKIGWDKQASCGMYYDIMPNDGLKRCYCPVCTAAFAKAKNPVNYATEVIWGKTAELGRRLKADGVGGYLTQMAYSGYRDVPDVELPDNIIVTVCNNGAWVQGKFADRDFALVKRWYEKAGKMKLYNNTGKFRSHATDIPDVPTTTPFAVARFYNRVSPYVRGAYFCGPADRFLYTAMNSYVFSRIAWYGQADVAAIMDEHYRLMYGAAAKPMKEFFTEIERKWMKEVLGEIIETSIGTKNLIASEFRMRTEIYSEKAIKPLAALLDKAAAAVPAGSLEARRIALVRREYVDAPLKAAQVYTAGLSVAAEKARRAAHQPKSVVKFKPTTITVGKNEADKPFKAVKFAADIKPGKWYRVSYFVKGEDIKPNAKRGGAQAVVWQSEAIDKGKTYPATGFDGSFDWVHHSSEFRIPKRVPEDFKPEVDVRIIHATGTAHFDGLIVEEIEKKKKK